MAEPTLEQIFGIGSTQSSTTLTIPKAGLTAVGLTAVADNTAESLLLAIILNAKGYLSSENQQTDPDIQITIEQTSPSLTSRNETTYKQDSLIINLDTPYIDTGLDPDDF